ncbi:MAG: methyltransferase domain-containing protein [Candidatus Nomurabacteria bacterium]|nr:MAG: methyltransferase domain-containing protein [Candidatus Nomurabacteria bacterium]
MYIAMLGRQPAISMAELERTFDDVRWFSHDMALVNTDELDIEQLGGTVKAGRVILELSGADWRKTSVELVRTYFEKWSSATGKITLGVSVYGFKVSPRDVQRTGLILKSQLKSKGVSLRLVPNEQPILSTATSHHNKLGLSPNKIELLVVRGHGGKVVIAESTGSQNITALARRDQARPARDAFVGMLPPKLAQIMINLAKPSGRPPVILDPFCGTGVILQEAALMGYDANGTDLSEKMVSYSQRNLEWLKEKYNTRSRLTVSAGDAMTTIWDQPIDAVVCESYLGQPFSAPPSPKKLEEVVGNCDHIISGFLANISNQIEPGTPLCVAVPSWRGANDWFTHLPLIKKLDQLGYKQIEFKNVNAKDLLYYRPDQVVARELLVLEKK